MEATKQAAATRGPCGETALGSAPTCSAPRTQETGAGHQSKGLGVSPAPSSDLKGYFGCENFGRGYQR